MTIDTTHRLARLQDAINHFAGGNKTRFGKEIGYTNGTFVRQMCSGFRPLSEKTMAKIEERYQCPGWFAAPSDTVVDTPAGKVGILDDGAGLRVPVLAHEAGARRIIVGPVSLSPAWVTQQINPSSRPSGSTASKTSLSPQPARQVRAFFRRLVAY